MILQIPNHHKAFLLLFFFNNRTINLYLNVNMSEYLTIIKRCMILQIPNHRKALLLLFLFLFLTSPTDEGLTNHRLTTRRKSPVSLTPSITFQCHRDISLSFVFLEKSRKKIEGNATWPWKRMTSGESTRKSRVSVVHYVYLSASVCDSLLLDTLCFLGRERCR